MELYKNRYNLAVQHTVGVVTMQLAEYLEHVLFKVESKILAKSSNIQNHSTHTTFYRFAYTELICNKVLN